MDSTTIRIGKGKDKKTYSGYKQDHWIKYQVIINNNNPIEEVSKGYSGSVHDKKLFLKEYELINDKIDKTLQNLGDKVYVGLDEYKIKTPTKSNELEYKKNKVVSKEKNKNLSSKRIKIEQIYLLSYNAYICLNEKLYDS